MAGTGPAPKPGIARRNSSAPGRGDWITLPAAVGDPPTLPDRGKGRGSWSARTRRAWKAWWIDPASSQWGPSEADLVEHLADCYEEWVRDPRANMASEIRQLRDGLGLTPKGKQDRRWASAPVDDVSDETPAGVTALADYRKTLAG